jgi:hypothetical protein
VPSRTRVPLPKEVHRRVVQKRLNHVSNYILHEYHVVVNRCRQEQPRCNTGAGQVPGIAADCGARWGRESDRHEHEGSKSHHAIGRLTEAD